MSELTAIDNSIISIGNSLVQLVPSVDPYNPLGLPPFTVRVRYVDGANIDWSLAPGATNIVQVSESPNIWDLTREDPDWHRDGSTRFIPPGYYGTELREVLGANSTGVTNMGSLFGGYLRLSKVALFDTSSVTNMETMFYDTQIRTIPLFDTSKVTNVHWMFKFCEFLEEIPLFDTSSVTNMRGFCADCNALKRIPLFDVRSVRCVSDAFANCYKVESGALDLYNRLSKLGLVIGDYYDAFFNCGRDTVTGAAELAQIPDDWGGSGA